jgi:hypothetical protein
VTGTQDFGDVDVDPEAVTRQSSCAIVDDFDIVLGFAGFIFGDFGLYFDVAAASGWRGGRWWLSTLPLQ